MCVLCAPRYHIIFHEHTGDSGMNAFYCFYALVILMTVHGTANLLCVFVVLFRRDTGQPRRERHSSEAVMYQDRS